MRRLYSVSELAARFEVTSQTVRNWIAAGQLPSVQATPGGRYRIPAEALLRFERDSGRPSIDGLAPPEGQPITTLAGTHLGELIASELRRVVQAIVTGTQADGVILFGSRSRGDFQADSDFDLAILAPDGAARRRVAMRAYENLAGVSGRSVAVDIIVLTPSIISAERDLAGSIARAVSREGIVLYGNASALA